MISSSLPEEMLKLFACKAIPYLTTFGCWTSFKIDISLMAVLGTPSSSVSKRIFFRATNLPVALCLAWGRNKILPALNL